MDQRTSASESLSSGSERSVEEADGRDLADFIVTDCDIPDGVDLNPSKLDLTSLEGGPRTRDPSSNQTGGFTKVIR